MLPPRAHEASGALDWAFPRQLDFASRWLPLMLGFERRRRRNSVIRPLSAPTPPYFAISLAPAIDDAIIADYFVIGFFHFAMIAARDFATARCLMVYLIAFAIRRIIGRLFQEIKVYCFRHSMARLLRADSRHIAGSAFPDYFVLLLRACRRPRSGRSSHQMLFRPSKPGHDFRRPRAHWQRFSPMLLSALP